MRIAPLAHSITRDLADGGRVYTFPFLVSKEFQFRKRPVGSTFNFGVERGSGGAPDDRYWSGAVGTVITPLTAGLISFSDQRFYDPQKHRILKLEVGVTRYLKDDLKIFAMAGRILKVETGPDGRPHFIWNAGIQVIIRRARRNN